MSAGDWNKYFTHINSVKSSQQPYGIDSVIVLDLHKRDSEVK